MLEENKLSKDKQKNIVVISVIVIFIFFAVFLFFDPSKDKKDEIREILEDQRSTITISDPSSGIKAEDRWLEVAEKKLQGYEDFRGDYEKEKARMQKEIASITKSLKKQEDILYLQESKSQAQKPKREVNELSKKNDYFDSSSKIVKRGVKSGGRIASIDIGLEENSFSKRDGFFDSRNYVAAGAYASAKIISGVDASVGIVAQADPRPVLLRVNSYARSSIYDGDIQETDIKGCIITGAASGDLSSEKVYVKLVKMTCGKDKDMLTEINIKGYVAGQGKSGVRGSVVSREGDLVAKSFLAGLIGGFGQGLSQKVAPPLNFSNGLTTQGTLSSSDVAKQGLGQGVATSSNRLSQYLIDRAEQYQPVISIPSGIDVEVVFVEGFSLNGGNIKNLEKNNEVKNDT